jgi:hypothetical protein
MTIGYSWLCGNWPQGCATAQPRNGAAEASPADSNELYGDKFVDTKNAIQQSNNGLRLKQPESGFSVKDDEGRSIRLRSKPSELEFWVGPTKHRRMAILGVLPEPSFEDAHKTGPAELRNKSDAYSSVRSSSIGSMSHKTGPAELRNKSDDNCDILYTCKDGHKNTQSASIFKKFSGQKGERQAIDPSYIIIDEVIGQLIAFTIVLSLARLTTATVLLSFVFFRFFDILKPWPIKSIERELEKDKRLCAISIILDDVIAGIFAGLSVCLYAKLT